MRNMYNPLKYVALDLNASGAVVAKYVQGKGIDEPLASSNTTGTAFYEADGLGSITSLSSAAGVIASYNYKPFGITTAAGNFANRFRFTGREWDQETALYYYRARYYDPQIGRFISEDPIRFHGGINFYDYVFNSPTTLRDPRGTDAGPKGPGGYPNANNNCASPSVQSPCYFWCPNGNILQVGSVTVSASTTVGYANYSSTNDVSAVVGVALAPSFGASFDISINAPSNPVPVVTVGLGKNLGVGTFITNQGVQGVQINLGVSVGPPVTLTVPVGNVSEWIQSE
jgi:RHS repeat-associated protein